MSCSGRTPHPDAVVGLLDQFDDPENVEVVRARRFCNPVGKFHRGQFSPVQDERQHLTFYATFPQSAPLRIVRLSNQFNPAGRPSRCGGYGKLWPWLCPRTSRRTTRPWALTTIGCYAANGNPVFEGVGLVDQFVPFVGHFVLNPVLFCNPVQKTHGPVWSRRSRIPTPTWRAIR